MGTISNQRKKGNKTMLTRKFMIILLICIMAFILSACSKEEGSSQKAEKINITGNYEGTATVTKAKNDYLGSTQEMAFRIEQKDNGKATLIINDNRVEASYNPETQELYFEYGFVWRLKFASEDGTITAKGTMTSDETGEGFTQEVTLSLKKTGE